MNKISRRDFLHMGAFGIGAALFQTIPQPDDYQVYLPMVNSGCSQDYQKLYDYTADEIVPGFIFSELGDFRKFVLEITAKMTVSPVWSMSLRANNKGYAGMCEWFETFNQAAFPDEYFEPAITKPLIDTSWQFEFQPAAIAEPSNYPYCLKLEIDNVAGMFKTIYGVGVFPVGGEQVLYLTQYQYTGIYKNTDLITRLNLCANYPDGAFDVGSTVTLYGVK